MMIDLKIQIESIHKLSYPLVFLSIPDMFVKSRRFADERFEKAAQAAGFEPFRGGQGSSRSALDYYKIEDCDEDYVDPSSPYSCLPSVGRIDDVLTISFAGTNLGFTLHSRWNKSHRVMDGVVWPEKQEVDFELVFHSDLRIEDPQMFWEKIQKTIELVIGNHKLDRVILLGDFAKEVEFRRTVRDTLHNLGHYTASKEISVPGTAMDFDESLYAAARGAANVARRGMIHGFVACIIPDWCERVEEIPMGLDTDELKMEL